MKKFVLLASTVLFALLENGLANPVLYHVVPSSDDNVQEVAASVNCPAGYSQPANQNWTSCYKVYNNYKSRKAAATQCSHDNGTLVSVPNAFVNSYLYSLATNTQPAASSLWLGIECFNGDTTSCVNDDGTPFRYNNFFQGQPTSQDICVYMSTIGRDSQKWSTFDCEQNFNYACEVAVGQKNQNLVCPQGYLPFQGMCYMTTFAADGIANDQQVAQCRKQPGGNLATIASAAVSNFLVNNLPQECLSGYYSEIGLRCPNRKFDGDTSNCAWDDGTTFSYQNFDFNEPTMNSNYYGDCVVFTNYGKWLGRDCGAEMDCYTCQSTGI